MPDAEEIHRLLAAQRMRGDFVGIHTRPESPEEVPDQAAAWLIVLGPEHHHDGGADSPGLVRARALLDGVERVYRNMLVFLAADAAALGDGDPLAAWTWLLVPTAGVWRTIRTPGRGDLAMRASSQLRADRNLYVEYPGDRLRADLDRLDFWQAGRHARLADVWALYASSLELPRLRSSAVLAAAVLHGIGAERPPFAYAASFDDASGRYDGLVVGEQADLRLAGSGLIVHPDALESQGVG